MQSSELLFSLWHWVYRVLDVAATSTRKHGINIAKGYFNAQVGQGEVSKCAGKFGLGVRNELGYMLVEFYQNENFVITNKIVRQKTNQYCRKSDFILINYRFKAGAKSVNTYPGPDVNSDHKPLETSINYEGLKLPQ